MFLWLKKRKLKKLEIELDSVVEAWRIPTRDFFETQALMLWRQNKMRELDEKISKIKAYIKESSK